MLYYIESSHMTKKTGDLVLNFINNKQSNIDDFGIELTLDNIDHLFGLQKRCFALNSRYQFNFNEWDR